MKKSLKIFKNENGSLIVVVMLLLALLTIVGTATISSSIIEVRVASNEKFHKMAFYGAESGVNVGTVLLEQNICCPTGFKPTGKNESGVNIVRIGDIEVVAPSLENPELAFWKNAGTDELKPNDTNRDFYFPIDSGKTSHTNVKISGNAVLSPGGAVMAAAGYEGKGKSVAGGGSFIDYKIYSVHEGKMGRSKSTAAIALEWKHVIGQEGKCKY